MMAILTVSCAYEVKQIFFINKTKVELEKRLAVYKWE